MIGMQRDDSVANNLNALNVVVSTFQLANAAAQFEIFRCRNLKFM